MLVILAEAEQRNNASDYGGSIAANTESKWRAKGYCQASENLSPWKRREPHSPSPYPLPRGEGEVSAALGPIVAF